MYLKLIQYIEIDYLLCTRSKPRTALGDRSNKRAKNEEGPKSSSLEAQKQLKENI